VELPRLQPLWEKYRERGFSVVAVEATGDRQNALALIRDNGLDYHLLANGEGENEVVRSEFGVRGFPTSYLIDRQGRILFYHLGFSPGDEQELEKEIRRLL
jgi:cytochrome c biogenesis protein CcmG/thiol:disulfide interchange protein DsbE